MATAQIQHINDFAAVLADPSGPAVEITISTAQGSWTIKGIRELRDYAPYASLEIVQAEKQNLYVLRSDLGFMPVPGLELILDGSQWTVDSVPWKGEVLQIAITGYRV
ncbi:hypothetical protein [Desulfogranum japonicum]|uniref:hypothetical protein n=1 Tax=Desulfogranum japonicum TaxID=231447 RepID=UPI0003F84D8D|nr:hypothetical protein [Desulfogranum japonicum]